MIKGLIFDLDGVIADTAILHFKAWQLIVKDLGIDYSYEENEKLRGLPRKDTLLAIFKLKKFEKKLSDQELDQICDLKNAKYKELLATELNTSWILPNIQNFILEAKANNIKLAIASSSHNAPTILTKLGLIDYFDFIVNPSNVKHGKPAPDIFIQAAEGLNLQNSECLGIEDAPAGVAAIKSANIRAIAITHGSSEDFSQADLVLQSTSELSLTEILAKFK
ncbi:beta-phosphoglucomutase [Mycoplasmopsis gallopavonis]|uniref:Beta-phosphoglucomutase n=1 Tax=Mycoplasmopsis gallopavonis TaxID=76629 RepID=A0A449B0P2_9BACT|nr:beta-phosphoglucomutase [Mycoplasmopsis gallopavonis]RIV16997.1 beta-phosphoglucomutase [Mycoplasmopsis gallopavonis]VEU73298.1 beta-phosphoglucomutase (beta-PGM) domain-containing protein [Mycoplasmopsis gallopavonis]